MQALENKFCMVLEDRSAIFENLQDKYIGDQIKPFINNNCPEFSSKNQMILLYIYCLSSVLTYVKICTEHCIWLNDEDMKKYVSLLSF